MTNKYRLSEEEIETAKKEADRLSWTHKIHSRFEKERYLLEAQIQKLIKLGWKSPEEVEELVEQGIDAAITAYESTCEELIKKAKKQERERIGTNLEDLIYSAELDMRIEDMDFLYSLIGKLKSGQALKEGEL